MNEYFEYFKVFRGVCNWAVSSFLFILHGHCKLKSSSQYRIYCTVKIQDENFRKYTTHYKSEHCFNAVNGNPEW